MVDFDQMEQAEQEPYWANLNNDGYTLEAGDETVETIDGALVGVLTNIEENVGKNDSRLYTFDVDGVDRPVKVWGSGHLNNQVDSSPISLGYTVGIKRTGEKRQTKNGEMDVYDVRFTE